MNSPDDDGIVVSEGIMETTDRRMSLAEYLRGPETNRPQELAYGFVREPAAPGYGHQLVSGRIHVRLDRHVRRYHLGQVVEAPVDVVLDRRLALVVQPDIAFVSTVRLDICRDRIWGPPDLVVEVLSTFRRRHDRTTKVGWYRRYGVRECWIADPTGHEIAVIDLTGADPNGHIFEDRQVIRSTVLPRLRMRARDAFLG